MKKYWILFIAIGLTVAAVLTVNTAYNNADETSPASAAQPVLLLTEDETGSFYMRLKQGMEDEADITGANVTTSVLGADAETQIAGLAGENYSAAVVYIRDNGMLAQTLEALRQSNIPSITIGNAQGDYAVMQDTMADARQMAACVRETGCTRVLMLEGDNGAISDDFTSLWDGELIMIATPADGSRYPDACLVGFSAQGIRTLLDAKAEGGIPATMPFFCCDTGTSRAADLETGYIMGMLVSRPYKIGCLAMDACNRLTGKSGTATVTRYASCIITTGNMYDADNVDIMFPLLL